eukprot:PhM_4_TR3883/c0_g1_i1/m.24869
MNNNSASHEAILGHVRDIFQNHYDDVLRTYIEAIGNNRSGRPAATTTTTRVAARSRSRSANNNNHSAHRRSTSRGHEEEAYSASDMRRLQEEFQRMNNGIRTTFGAMNSRVDAVLNSK